MSRSVQVTGFGGPEVLHLSPDLPTQTPDAGQIRVAVKTAAVNRVDALYRSGAVSERLPLRPPSGIGLDFAGVVDAIGDDVNEPTVGTPVYGSAPFRSMADHVITDAISVAVKPDGLSWELAACIPTAGTTGYNAARSLALTDQDTVLVSAAAGGVGLVAAQTARLAGASVIGTASESNHELLRSLGVIPIAYGPDLAARVAALAPRRPTAALENHGSDAIETAIALGVRRDRINSVVGNDMEWNVHGVGMQGTPEVMDAVAQLLATGVIKLPIQQVFDASEIVAAHTLLDTGHLTGKLVIRFAG